MPANGGGEDWEWKGTWSIGGGKETLVADEC